MVPATCSKLPLSREQNLPTEQNPSLKHSQNIKCALSVHALMGAKTHPASSSQYIKKQLD